MLASYISHIGARSIFEIYLNDKSGLTAERHDYAQVDFSQFEQLDLFPCPENFSEKLLLDSSLDLKDIQLGEYDVVFLNNVLPYTRDLIRALSNIISSLKPHTRLIIALKDRRFSRDCLRADSKFSEALGVYNQELPLSYIGFDAAYNQSMPYDAPSYWNAFPVTGRQACNFEQALRVKSELAAGKDIFIPYWCFEQQAFLLFLQQILLSGLLAFRFNFILPVQRYKNTFYIDLQPVNPQDDADYDLQEQINKLSSAIAAINNTYALTDQDLVASLYKEVDAWKDEFYHLKSLYFKVAEDYERERNTRHEVSNQKIYQKIYQKLYYKLRGRINKL